MRELDVHGQRLNDTQSATRLGLGPRDYWGALKREFWLLACTTDRRYTSLRKRIKSCSQQSQLPAISMISAALGAKVGIVPGLLVPYVALLIKFCLEVGLGTFCGAVRTEVMGHH